MSKYDDIAAFWNGVFQNANCAVPASGGSGNDAFDRGLSWLCSGVDTVLDFGCGNGTALILCSFYGTKNHIGIDLSDTAIQNAKLRCAHLNQGTFRFLCGGIDELSGVADGSVGAAVLSNIVDNLYPADAETLIKEVNRILNKNGKVLVKLNPYLTESDIAANQMTVLEDNMLDDGLLLWNNTTEQWRAFFERYFTVFRQYDIYYKEHEQYNRVFLLAK